MVINNTLSTVIFGIMIYTYWLYIRGFEEISQESTFVPQKEEEKNNETMYNDTIVY
jgi:hypothetical protein